MATVSKRHVLIFGHSQARNLNGYVASDVSKAKFGFEVYKMLRLGVRDMTDLNLMICKVLIR